MANVMRQFLDNSYLYGANATFIEDLYKKYLVNPQSVAEEWREYFDRMQVLPGSSSKERGSKLPPTLACKLLSARSG